MPRLYHYVGPEDVRRRTAGAPSGTPISSVADISGWVEETNQEPNPAGLVAVTFVVDEQGGMLAGDRRQSTGYCPEPESWPAVAGALDDAVIAHSGGFTLAVVFRRCTACGQRNVVRDGWFACGVCGAGLPAQWNFATEPDE